MDESAALDFNSFHAQLFFYFFAPCLNCDFNVITPRWISSNYLNVWAPFCRLLLRKKNWIILAQKLHKNMLHTEPMSLKMHPLIIIFLKGNSSFGMRMTLMGNP